MHHRLRDGLSWCLCGEQAVFLDLAHDRYFRLSREDDRHFQAWSARGCTTAEGVDRLVKARILVSSESAVPPATMTQVPPPSTDLADETDRGARWIDVGRAIVAQRRAGKLVSRGRLPKSLAAIAADPSAATPPGHVVDAAVRQVAAAFASTILSFHKVDQCLPRALAAQAMCREAGVLPTLVFGVRLEPFAAHCWLQWGSAVVVGDLEQARMFTPILAVP